MSFQVSLACMCLWTNLWPSIASFQYSFLFLQHMAYTFQKCWSWVTALLCSGVFACQFHEFHGRRSVATKRSFSLGFHCICILLEYVIHYWLNFLTIIYLISSPASSCALFFFFSNEIIFYCFIFFVFDNILFIFFMWKITVLFDDR